MRTYSHLISHKFSCTSLSFFFLFSNISGEIWSLTSTVTHYLLHSTTQSQIKKNSDWKVMLSIIWITAIANLWWHQKKVPSISLIKISLWTFVEAKFPKIEIKHDALFEGWWYKGRNICQIGPNWLCILITIFKRASCFISILVIWASTKVHKVIFTSEALGTFFGVNTASQH